MHFFFAKKPASAATKHPGKPMVKIAEGSALGDGRLAGNANLPIGILHEAIQENGVPRMTLAS
jgi:hypothetical protein